MAYVGMNQMYRAMPHQCGCGGPSPYGPIGYPQPTSPPASMQYGLGMISAMLNGMMQL